MVIRGLQNKETPFWLAVISKDNALGRKIVLKISQLLLKLLLLRQLFVWTVFQPWALSSDVPAAKNCLFTNCPLKQSFASVWLGFLLFWALGRRIVTNTVSGGNFITWWNKIGSPSLHLPSRFCKRSAWVTLMLVTPCCKFSLLSSSAGSDYRLSLNTVNGYHWWKNWCFGRIFQLTLILSVKTSSEEDLRVFWNIL